MQVVLVALVQDAVCVVACRLRLLRAHLSLDECLCIVVADRRCEPLIQMRLYGKLYLCWPVPALVFQLGCPTGVEGRVLCNHRCPGRLLGCLAGCPLCYFLGCFDSCPGRAL